MLPPGAVGDTRERLCSESLGAFGSTALVEAPIPRLAFHLASDSSSASSCEYSASDFFSPTL